MHEAPDPTSDLRRLEEIDRRPVTPAPPAGFDDWDEFYDWERRSDEAGGPHRDEPGPSPARP